MPLTDEPFLPPSFFFCHLHVCSQAHRLTPDFPEALYELLCTLQEGRRLNDQRCSFRLESGVRRRRCHSEPNTTKPANRGGSICDKTVCFHVVMTHVEQAVTEERCLLYIFPYPLLPSKLFFLPFLHSHLFLHDLTAERGVF